MQKLALFLLLFSNLLIAQNDGWNKIKEDIYQKTVKENSKETVKAPDIVAFTTYGFAKGETIQLDPAKQITSVQTSFEDLKSFIKSDLDLKKDSKYLVKIQMKEPESYKYNIFLLDKITKQDKEKLEHYLKKNYDLTSIQYISKEDAKNNAKKELGVEEGDLFEEDVFPASFQLYSKTPLQLEPITKLFPKIVEDTIDNNQLPHFIVFDVKT
ncbi:MULTISPECIES: permease-like cell division protein FtsX [unclassified Chryseobacterium]|uniref:permease-like cell division protein FtsX n=1 Tax=unclassified Chryseobacterium TaxID=2593645 RepID=UPI002269F65B|nr:MULTISPECIES: permease-like cell division protein FtsX [unclassified Chryseobacterium]